jgi:predicted nucleotidyltransferase
MQEQITEHLKEKYGAEIIILHGSRATGKSRENSDWDLFVFTKKDVKREVEDFNNNKLDVYIVKMPVVTEEFVDDYGYVLNTAKIILDDTENAGQKIIEEAKTMYVLGKKLTDSQLTNRNNFMSRTLDRMSAYADQPEYFLLYLGYFYERTFQYWFEMKGKYSKPIYDAIPQIKQEDPEYYILIQELSSSSKSNQDKLSAAGKIFSLLFKA